MYLKLLCTFTGTFCLYRVYNFSLCCRHWAVAHVTREPGGRAKPAAGATHFGPTGLRSGPGDAPEPAAVAATAAPVLRELPAAVPAGATVLPIRSERVLRSSSPRFRGPAAAAAGPEAALASRATAALSASPASSDTRMAAGDPGGQEEYGGITCLYASIV